MPTATPTVLIVDDSAAIRTITADILRAFGFSVQEAEGGIEGISLFKQQPPDVVVLDLNMPDMNGAAVYHQLAQLDPHVKVVVYSSYSQSVVNAEFAPQQIKPDYLHKPADTMRLIAKVESALGSRAI